MKTTTRAAALFLALSLLLTLCPAALASGEPEAAPAEASGEPPAASAPEPTEAPAEEPDEALPADASEEPQEAPEEPDDAPAAQGPEPLLPSVDGAGPFPNDLYLYQLSRGLCTLTSCAMMIRARLYLSGSDDWSTTTAAGIRSAAWLEGVGLRFSFTYSSGGNRITVSHATVNGLSTGALKSLLDEHPEGVVIYVYDVPHAILVTDYEQTSDGILFYGADPANQSGMGRKPIYQTWLASQLSGTQSSVLSAVDAYWYVSSYSVASTTWWNLTFDANGGSCSEGVRSIRGGSAIGTLPTAARRSYVFGGWYTDPYGGTRVTEKSYFTSNATVYAHWTPVNGALEFSPSPAAIRLADGSDTVTVKVTCTGQYNEAELRFGLNEGAEGYLSADWAGDWDGASRSVTFRASPEAGGTYYATFYMYDGEDTSHLLSMKELAVNVINENIYLEADRTSFQFDSDTLGVGTARLSLAGTAGPLPEGYILSVVGDPLGAVSVSEAPWQDREKVLTLHPNAGWMGSYPCATEVIVRLTDPGGLVCSEVHIAVTIVATSGVCGGDWDEENILWSFDGELLRVYAAEPSHLWAGDMWNFDVNYGSTAFWAPLADRIQRAEIGTGVTRIGECAFYRCTALRSVTVADTVAEIGRMAFYGCTSLYAAEIPGSVLFVGADAFHGCSALEELRFSEGTSRLSTGALEGCVSLRTLYIPESMTDLRLPEGTALREIYYGGSPSEWAALDAACHLTEALPENAEVYFAKEDGPAFNAGDAATILNSFDCMYDPANDMNADLVVDITDAAIALRRLVGLDLPGE